MVAEPSSKVTASNRTPLQTNLLEMVSVSTKMTATLSKDNDNNSDVFF